MKKIYFFATLAVAAATLTSCEADKEPIYHAPDPATFVLNTPPMANQTYILETGGDIEITTSQPDYSVATPTNYSIDVTLADAFVEASEGVEANYITVLPKQPTQARMLFDAKTLNQTILDLMGIKTYNDYPEEGLAPVELNIRAHAWLTGVESSRCVSNTITLKSVQPYNPYSEGGRVIYWVGDVSGWVVDATDAATQYADWVLTETEKGSNIYVAAFNVPAGAKNFRFFTELGDWGKGSIGSTADGSNLTVAVTDQPVEHPAYSSGGNWTTEESWAGGYITFTVDLNDEEHPAVTMQAGNWDTSKLDFIYLVGDCSVWSVDADNAEELYANFKLYDWEGNGIYSNTFEVAADKATFRFYTELGDWGKGSLGSQDEDNPIDITMTDGNYAGAYVNGKGSWKVTNWEGGKMKMVVNTNDMTVDFSAAE
ncbi:MAG: hypothetical protein HDR85_08100 [Bacteroides sp.]|nr:hypothetical protein [Bacteroides sp.]